MARIVDEPKTGESVSIRQLSSNGMKRVLAGCLEMDFAFIVDHHVIHTNFVFAAFLSGKIQKLKAIDACCSKYTVKTECSPSLFMDFMSLGMGESITVSADDVMTFLSLCCELENEELVSQIVMLCSDKIPIQTHLSFLQLRYSDTYVSDAVIDQVAAHFSELSDADLATLDLSALHRILSSPRLNLDSEDDLYRKITALTERDPAYSELFEYVLFENLTQDAITSFTDSSYPLIANNLTAGIWSNLCRCLKRCTKSINTTRYKLQPTPPEMVPVQEVHESTSSDDDVTSIISHLTEAWEV